MADADHVVESPVLMVWIQLGSQIGQSLPQIGRRQEVRIARRIQIAPELKMLTDDGISPEIVEHFGPRRRRGQ